MKMQRTFVFVTNSLGTNCHGSDEGIALATRLENQHNLNRLDSGVISSQDPLCLHIAQAVGQTCGLSVTAFRELGVADEPATKHRVIRVIETYEDAVSDLIIITDRKINDFADYMFTLSMFDGKEASLEDVKHASLFLLDHQTGTCTILY
jgi:hypothetical protein